MRKRLHFLVALLFILNITSISLAQFEKWDLAQDITLKPGLGFEYLSRTINWDENKYTSKIKSCLFFFNMEFEIKEGVFLNLILGYSTSNYDGMIFRQLPISVELEVGGIDGYLFGGEIEKNIISIVNFEIALFGQFVYSLGVQNKWEIPNLNVEGEVEGKPSWMKAIVGPVFRYKGFEYFYPYLLVNFNKLWGTFKMNETIEDLTGSENKKFSGEENFGISIGSIYEVSKSFSLKGEASFIPVQNRVDWGFMIKATYSF